MRGSRNKGYGMLILFLLTGAVLGGILGEIIVRADILGGWTMYLVKSFIILDVPPVTINLYIVRFIVGLSLQPNILSILGMIIALLLFRK